MPSVRPRTDASTAARDWEPFGLLYLSKSAVRKIPSNYAACSLSFIISPNTIPGHCKLFAVSGRRLRGSIMLANSIKTLTHFLSNYFNIAPESQLESSTESEVSLIFRYRTLLFKYRNIPSRFLPSNSLAPYTQLGIHFKESTCGSLRTLLPTESPVFEGSYEKKLQTLRTFVEAIKVRKGDGLFGRREYCG